MEGCERMGNGMGTKHLPKWLAVLRKVLSFPTAVVIILIAFALVISRTASQKILALETYDRILSETHLVERSHGMVANWIITSGLQISSNSNPPYLSAVTARDWESVAEVALPEAWYSDALRGAFVAVLDWFKRDGQDYPQVQIDLIPIKNILNGPNGALAILPLMKNIPDCPVGETVVITKYVATGLISCWPAQDSLVGPAAEIAKDMARLFADQITVSSIIDQGYLPQTALDRLRQAHTTVKQVQEWNIWFLVIGLLLLALYCGLNASSIEMLLRSLLLPLYGTAGLTLLFTAVMYVLSGWVLGPALAGGMAGAPIETQSLLLDILRSLTKILTAVWGMYGVLALVAGILIHAAFLLLKAHHSRSNRKAALPAQTYLRIKKPIR